MLQNILVFLILLLAVLWAIWRITQSFKGKANKCDGCEGCIFAEKRGNNNCSKEEKTSDNCKNCDKSFGG